ncbi:MAG: hypothetical protein ACI9WU_004418, partial [Myxococcota bacterium]
MEVVLKAQLAGLACVVALGIFLTGCGKKSGGLSGKLEKANEERESAASSGATAIIDRYVQGMVKVMPPAGAPSLPGKPSPMSIWRKTAAEDNIAAVCKEQGAEFGDTGAGPMYQDCALLFAAVRNYWLGREVKGPAKKKEWEEGYQASLKVAAREGAREMIPLNDHVKQMKELGREDGSTWRVVADFELLLPHLMQIYQYRTYQGVIQATSFSRVWQVMFELPRTRDADGPESYQPYRDRLCKTKLGTACDVPYEHR